MFDIPDTTINEKEFAEIKKTKSDTFCLTTNISYFIPNSKRFNQVYGGMMMYQFEMKFLMFSAFSPYLRAGYSYISGKSLLGRNTNLYAIPLESGIELSLFKESRTEPFINLGFLFSYYHITNEFRCIPSIQHSWAYGVAIRGGSIFNLQYGLCVLIFLDYMLFATTHFSPQFHSQQTENVDLSGLSLGGGIGYKF